MLLQVTHIETNRIMEQLEKTVKMKEEALEKIHKSRQQLEQMQVRSVK